MRQRPACVGVAGRCGGLRPVWGRVWKESRDEKAAVGSRTWTAWGATGRGPLSQAKLQHAAPLAGPEPPPGLCGRAVRTQGPAPSRPAPPARLPCTISMSLSRRSPSNCQSTRAHRSLRHRSRSWSISLNSPGATNWGQRAARARRRRGASCSGGWCLRWRPGGRVGPWGAGTLRDQPRESWRREARGRPGTHE
jgi:hypothetical protein